MLLALQKRREKENISPGLPNSLALQFSLGSSCRLCPEQEGNEINDQRNSTVDRFQISFSVAAVGLYPWVGPRGCVTSGLHRVQE